MRRVLMLAAGVSALLAASPASATLQIAFGNGASTFFCADQTSCDLDGAAKNLLLLNTTVGDIRIVGTFAESGTDPNLLSTSNLTITNLSATSTETLRMAVGDTSFIAPVSRLRESGSGTFNNDVGGSLNLSFFVDPLNGQPASVPSDLPGIMVFSVGETVTDAPDSFSGTHDTFITLRSPFSMSEAATLTLRPGASVTGFNESMTAIPEAGTWAMMGVGFALLGLVGRKRGMRLAI